MGSVNKVILVGNLGRDAELRFTPGGAAVATLNMATTEVWNDKQGQKQEKTEWHRVVVWGKQAESLQEYLVKGKQIYVEGRLQTRQWDDKDGQQALHDGDQGRSGHAPRWWRRRGAKRRHGTQRRTVQRPGRAPDGADDRRRYSVLDPFHRSAQASAFA